MLPAPDSQRHDWLDAKLRRDYDDPGSATLDQLLDESDGSHTSSQDVMETTMEGKVDIMLAGLNSNRNNAGPTGQATGPSEAFYPPIGFRVAGDYVVSQDELTRSFSDSDEGDIHMDIRNFISFDDDPSDEDESPTSPGVVINMPPVSELPGFAVNDTFPHVNVMQTLLKLCSILRRTSPASHETKPPAHDLKPPRLVGSAKPATSHISHLSIKASRRCKDTSGIQRNE
jgi:hypothetical protein